jgi:hypothetical protein
MLLFQVLITTFISVSFSVINISNTIAVVILKYQLSRSAQAIDSFAYNLFPLFYKTNPVIGFYIYTLTSFKFRVEMNRCIQYGLKFVLTATDPIRCLSTRTRQKLLDDKTKVIFVCKLWLDIELDQRYSHLPHRNRSTLFICAIDTQVLLIIVIRTLSVRQSVLVNDLYQILQCQHKRDPCRLKVL